MFKSKTVFQKIRDIYLSIFLNVQNFYSNLNLKGYSLSQFIQFGNQHNRQIHPSIFLLSQRGFLEKIKPSCSQGSIVWNV